MISQNQTSYHYLDTSQRTCHAEDGHEIVVFRGWYTYPMQYSCPVSAPVFIRATIIVFTCVFIVAVTASTTYVVSHYAPNGHHSVTQDYFTAERNKIPLHAHADGASGGNGVHSYHTASIFPTGSFRASNYWVDVIFANTAVLSSVPTQGATQTPLASEVVITMSEALDPATVSNSTVLLKGPAGGLVGRATTYVASDATIHVKPNASLSPGVKYTLTLEGGTAEPRIKDVTGNALSSDYTLSFWTAPIPASEGPGGPVLVVTDARNPFTYYLAEILKTEGLNHFKTIDITKVNSTALASYDLVIVGQMPLTSTQVTTFTTWVNGGGNLIAMRPDKQLANLLGLTATAGTFADKYLKVHTATAPGKGITETTMQYHGTADRYAVNSARVVATLYSTASTASVNPAVTVRTVGTKGGKASAFTFDLARSVALTRQGNPLWAGQERDGYLPKRPNDLFFPDYLDLTRVAIPQADEQQRLLVNLILAMNSTKKPLPRFWYLPSNRKAVIVMTGDDHSTPQGTKTVFDMLSAGSAPGCDVLNWNCYRATSWMYTNVGLTDTQVSAYASNGFELGNHVRARGNESVDCPDWTESSLRTSFVRDLAEFRTKYPSLPPQQTSRTHCIVWSDWATQPKVEREQGIRLDMNYYYWPSEWVQNRPGFMNGSGMPMKYVDVDGTRIDVYQAATHLVNENGVSYPAGIDAMLDRALGTEGYYGMFGTHFDYRGDNFELNAMNSAKARGVALVTAKQVLDWTDGHNNSSFDNLSWNGSQLTFATTIAPGARNLFAMLPRTHGTKQLTTLTNAGTDVATTREIIKGVDYTFFRAKAGTFTATYK